MFFKFLRLALITFSLTFSGTTVSEVAFIGDSISTGAVTNSKLSFNVANLWDYFTGKTYDGEVQTFKRLWPSRRDYRSPVEWVLKNIFMAFSTIYLDDESLSWSAQVGHDLGFDKNGILIAAEDGARVRNSISQIDKIFERTDYKIPEKVFYFFTGNDLCGPTLDFITSGEEYGRKVEDSFRYMMRNGKSAGSDVYVVGNMNVLQLVVGEAILSKEVDAHGKKITCKELREFNEPYAVDVDKDPNKAVFFQFFPRNPVGMCPTLFGRNLDYRGDEQNTILANRMRTFREALQKSVKNANAYADREGVAVKFHYLSETEKLKFRAEDIANDCFHLSEVGQKRLAEIISKEAKIIN